MPKPTLFLFSCDADIAGTEAEIKAHLATVEEFDPKQWTCIRGEEVPLVEKPREITFGKPARVKKPPKNGATEAPKPVTPKAKTARAAKATKATKAPEMPSEIDGERLRRFLATARSSQEIQTEFEAEKPTIVKAIKALGAEVQTEGKARGTRYRIKPAAEAQA